MTIRYITIDYLGHIHEVANLLDQAGKETSEPCEACTCVIKLDESNWVPTYTDQVPIYTVH